MNYEEGTIVKKRNIRFKQSDRIDFRTTGHPILLPVDFGFHDVSFYFFTLSSQVQHYVKDPDRYFLLKKSSRSGLKTNSIVDLKYVYKCDSFNSIPDGIIPEHLNRELIKKFFNYNELVIDDDCRDFLGIIEQPR